MSSFEIEKRILDRQPVRPASVSMGADNAYILACGPTEQRTSYCVCLHKMAALKRDGGLKSHPACETAIGLRACPAAALQSQEELQGRALFFLPRDELRKEMNAHWDSLAPIKVTAPIARPSIKAIPSPAKVAPAPAKAPVATSSYGDAINAALHDKTDFIPMLPGEAMADYAKRVLAVSQPVS